jgi:5-methylcytosine-specific restriction endonuclease McrA
MSKEAEIEAEIAQLKRERAPHKLIRNARMRLARLKGTHTKAEWEALKDEFQHRCVQCGCEGRHLDKDHIVPVYQGGSDGLDNIQPLCAPCNAGKGPDRFNWVEHRRAYGFEAQA